MMEMELELKDKLLKIEGNEMLGNFKQRQLLIYQAVTLAAYMGYKSGYRPVGNADGDVSPGVPEWAGNVVAYIVLPTGEVSYFLQKHDVEWEMYTREEKLKRINDFMEGKHHEASSIPVQERGRR